MAKDKKMKVDWAHVLMRLVLLSIVYTSVRVVMDGLAGDDVNYLSIGLTVPQILFGVYLLLKK